MATPVEGFPVPGERIGPYQVVRQLGMGGMGVVFEAVDTVLRRPVALKVIAPSLAGDPAFRRRFTQEAQAQASLDSPEVVQVFAHGQADPSTSPGATGALYIASQLIPGGDLGAMVRASGAPSPRVALDLVAQVASGLGDAHAIGLVHRDIKPANVLVRVRGEEVSAYLTDFGIARHADADPAIGQPLTGQGCAVGTPGYMAPELHTGGTAGAMSDVYSLGCLLWTALVGRAPYSGTTDYQLMSAHVSDPVPQLAALGPFEQEVNAILRRAMAKAPTARYPSARALRDDLRRVLHGHTAPASVRPAADPEQPGMASRPRPMKLVTALAPVAAVLVGGAVGLTLAVRSDEPRSGATTGTVLSADEQQAVDNIAAALVADADFEQADAACTARRLMTRDGIDGLREKDLIDGDLEFIADQNDTIAPEVLTDLITVGVACVFETVTSDSPPSPRLEDGWSRWSTDSPAVGG